MWESLKDFLGRTLPSDFISKLQSCLDRSPSPTVSVNYDMKEIKNLKKQKNNNLCLTDIYSPQVRIMNDANALYFFPCYLKLLYLVFLYFWFQGQKEAFSNLTCSGGVWMDCHVYYVKVNVMPSVFDKFTSPMILMFDLK